MIYDVQRTNEAHQIGVTIRNARENNLTICYFDIEFEENIRSLRELGFFVTYAPEMGAHSISWG